MFSNMFNQLKHLVADFTGCRTSTVDLYNWILNQSKNMSFESKLAKISATVLE